MQRKIARENAFLLIFEKSFKSDETAEEVFSKATGERELEYDDYVKKVFFGVFENFEIIEQEIEKHLMGWKKERVSPVSISILRLAAYEVMFVEDIPSRVSLNEAIELAKKYDDEKSYAFVNGVLNALIKSVEQDA
jgi:N utilization substance protein B